MIANVRREHPHLNIIVVEDSLASNGPHIDELRAHKMSFILGVKPKDHKWLFEWVAACPPKEFVMTNNEFCHRFHYVNDVPLSDSRSDCRVNFLEYWEENTKTGKIQHFSWVTDLHLTKNTVYQIMRGGRARWKIENETFNTLKNQGYYFEHNFGHGHKNLTTVLAHLMFLAFLVDQVQQLCCARFKQAWLRLHRKNRLWQSWCGHFLHYTFDNWEDFLSGMAHGIAYQHAVPLFDTS